jgi:AraC family transcriptional regulator
VPYTRDVLLAGAEIGLQQLTLDEARPGWSEPYRVTGARLLLPLEGAFGCEVGGQRWHCDAAVGLWLAPGEPCAQEAVVGVASTLAPAGGRAIVHRAVVERALAFLAARFTHDDRLEAIATAASCSAFHLARSFRRSTGHTLHAWRTRLRMSQALRRLATGADDLTALALELGYSSHSHFGQVFRASFGAPPSQVRRILVAAG